MSNQELEDQVRQELDEMYGSISDMNKNMIHLVELQAEINGRISEIYTYIQEHGATRNSQYPNQQLGQGRGPTMDEMRDMCKNMDLDPDDVLRKEADVAAQLAEARETAMNMLKGG